MREARAAKGAKAAVVTEKVADKVWKKVKKCLLGENIFVVEIWHVGYQKIRLFVLICLSL